MDNEFNEILKAMQSKESEAKEFEIWLLNGVDRGWISPPYCNTHDGGSEYMSEEEIEEWDQGGDPCAHVVRLIE
jgi:prophage antirepressor-like protein